MGECGGRRGGGRGGGEETPHHPGLHHHSALQAAQEVEGGGWRWWRRLSSLWVTTLTLRVYSNNRMHTISVLKSALVNLPIYTCIACPSYWVTQIMKHAYRECQQCTVNSKRIYRFRLLCMVIHQDQLA